MSTAQQQKKKQPRNKKQQRPLRRPSLFARGSDESHEAILVTAMTLNHAAETGEQISRARMTMPNVASFGDGTTMVDARRPAEMRQYKRMKKNTRQNSRRPRPARGLLLTHFASSRVQRQLKKAAVDGRQDGTNDLSGPRAIQAGPGGHFLLLSGSGSANTPASGKHRSDLW